MKVHFKKAAKKGFSLVELLVVIAVIGIMAAIAIPMIANINQKSKDAKDRRNAQSIASLANSALTAGHDFEAGETDGEKTIADALVEGVTITEQGSFQGTIFRVPNLSGEDVAGAIQYLEWDGASRTLSYNPGWTPAGDDESGGEG